jgi:hypothetical protein
MSFLHADAPEPIGRRIVAPLSSSSIGTVMSVSDDISLCEIPDRIETEPPENGTLTPDATTLRRGYQNLFRAVCLGRKKQQTEPV